MKVALPGQTSVPDVNSVSLDDYNIHVIASVLKQWLRDLPSPLMTFELYEEFLRAMGKQELAPLTVQRLLQLRVSLRKRTVTWLLMVCACFLFQVSQTSGRWYEGCIQWLTSSAGHTSAHWSASSSIWLGEWWDNNQHVLYSLRQDGLCRNSGFWNEICKMFLPLSKMSV